VATRLLKHALKVGALRLLLRALGVVVVVALAIVAAYRKGTFPTDSTQARRPAAPAVAMPALPPEEPRAPVVYQSKGRRDPFREPRVAGARQEPGVGLKVTGIVWGQRSYYAVVESETSPDRGYVIRENDVVDSARVLKILRDGVIFEFKTTTADGKPLTRYVRKAVGP
jgi:hypothetical protein